MKFQQMKTFGGDRKETGNRITPITWVHFVPISEMPSGDALGRGHRLDRYRVRDIRSIQGEAPPLARFESGLARIETESPLRSFGGNAPDSLFFRGTVQHLHYTGAAERQALQVRSRPELDLGGEATAVLILIGKSQEWWKLSQEERQRLFKETSRHEGHIGIGQRYADRIFRKLYYSRYLDPAAPYDFITYFEFEEDHESDFRTMLSELRDVRKNPEWLYVRYECEIWMTRRPS